MSDANKDVRLLLKVLIDKEKNKVLFAEAGSDFIDILLSFLTLPLGRIIKIFENQYGDDEVPRVGSLSSLYRSLADLDTSHFVTEGAKQSLLNPTSSSEAEYESLKLDIADYQPAEYYCDHNISICKVCKCHNIIQKEVAEKGCGAAAASGDGVFTINTASFVISDDLQIFPTPMEFHKIIRILGFGFTDVEKADVIQVTIGFNEMLCLLRASFISPTPLSDVILNTRAAIVDCGPKLLIDQIEIEENPDLKINLEVAIHESSGKLLYAKGGEDFVDFLVSLLFIPLGGLEHLLAGKGCFEAIKNLYRSTVGFIDDKYFKEHSTKWELMKPGVVHGCISDNHILRLTQKRLHHRYTDNRGMLFPKGQGRYLKGPTTYVVMDDLTVTPFQICSILSFLKKQNILISDFELVEMQIGMEEALSILKASLTSTSALTDALLTQKSNKRPKTKA